MLQMTSYEESLMLTSKLWRKRNTMRSTNTKLPNNFQDDNRNKHHKITLHGIFCEDTTKFIHFLADVFERKLFKSALPSI